MKKIFAIIVAALCMSALSAKMNSVHNTTRRDSEYFDKFFGEANFKDIKTQVTKEEPSEVYKRAVIVDDLSATELEWVVEVLRQQVDTCALGNKNTRSFIERLRAVLNDVRKEEQDSKEYQEYLRLKEKFGGE